MIFLLKEAKVSFILKPIIFANFEGLIRNKNFHTELRTHFKVSSDHLPIGAKANTAVIDFFDSKFNLNSVKEGRYEFIKL
jgi:hypothetical protein